MVLERLFAAKTRHDVELWIAPWTRPLRRPLWVGTAPPQTTRSGLLVALGAAGRWGFGDAAPLPGWSRETLDDVTTRLRHFAASSGATRARDLPPSLAWALHSAASELAASASDVTVGCARLVEATDDETLGEEALGALLETLEQRETLKLKVGRRDGAAECAAVRAVAAAGHRVRLDGNRRCSVEATLALVEAAGRALDFFEEPVAPALLPRLPARLPLAFDETLDERLAETSNDATAPTLDALAELSAAWVLKPTLLGPARCEAVVNAAARRGIRVIVSSAFESRIGRRALVLTAARWAPQTTHGLGTATAFADDIGSTRSLLLESGAESRALATSAIAPQQIDVPWERLAR